MSITDKASPVEGIVSRQRKALVHFIAECTDCDWTCEDYLQGQRVARAHAKRTGHRVKADLGYVVEYVA